MIDLKERIQDVTCDHDEQQVTKYRTANGTFQVVRQCLRCGARTSNALPQRDYDVNSLPDFDQVLRDEWWQNELQRRHDAATLQRAEQQSAWREDYSDYLESPHWNLLRRRVLVRDNFRCQNCFGKVTDANAHCHHISYIGLRQVGHSFAFECVTLCRTCHADFHPHMKENGHA